MELKKRGEITKRDYAKKNEITIRELKRETPKKWIVASSLGIATLFYSNSNSFFGKIGVVFGCIPIPDAFVINFSSTWHTLNSISNFMPMIYYSIAFFAFPLTLMEVVDYFELKSRGKLQNKGDFKNKNKIIIRFIITLWIIVFVAFGINKLLDNVILDMDIPVFFEGGKKEYVLNSEIQHLADYIKNLDKKSGDSNAALELAASKDLYSFNISGSNELGIMIPKLEIELLSSDGRIIKDNGVYSYLVNVSHEEEKNQFVKKKHYTFEIEYEGDYISKIRIIEQ